MLCGRKRLHFKVTNPLWRSTAFHRGWVEDRIKLYLSSYNSLVLLWPRNYPLAPNQDFRSNHLELDGCGRWGVSLTSLDLPTEHCGCFWKEVPGRNAHMAGIRMPDVLSPILSASGISTSLPHPRLVCLKHKQLIRKKAGPSVFNIFPAHSIQETWAENPTNTPTPLNQNTQELPGAWEV